MVKMVRRTIGAEGVAEVGDKLKYPSQTAATYALVFRELLLVLIVCFFTIFAALGTFLPIR